MQFTTMLSTLELFTQSYGFSRESYDVIDTLISENNYEQFPSDYSDFSILAIQHDYVDNPTNNTVQINYDLLNPLVIQNVSIDHDSEFDNVIYMGIV